MENTIVDSQYHIVSDAASGHIHSVLIVNTSHQERSRIDLPAIDECCII